MFKILYTKNFKSTKSQEPCCQEVARAAREQAQTFVEYTMLVGIIISVLIAMTPAIRRTVQAMVKLAADQLGNQQNAEQAGGRSGHLISSDADTRIDRRIRHRERREGSQVVFIDDYERDDLYLNTITLTNQGFTTRADNN